MTKTNSLIDPESILGNLHPYRERFETYQRLPQKGRPPDEIYQELKTMADEEDRSWETGRVSGTMYHGGKQHYSFLNRVFSLFSYVNILQRDLCPSATKFEAEIIAMVAKMLNGEAVKQVQPDDEVCGTITSGGTESIMNAEFVYREWARAEKGITAPEIVMPATAHPAFIKGGHYLGIKVISVPVTADFEADVEAMRAQITPNTIAIVGSAGSYPHGVIDPIEKLSTLALEHGIGLHVDGCLGGFILPWIERLGYDIPPFDFRLPGVTSMSCDTHKFGYALKGTSVVLYRNKKLRRYQFFSAPGWQGGIYASPTFQGSRSGGLTAATWAAMIAMGEEGYLEAARAIMTASDTIRRGIAAIPEIKIMGKSTFLIAMTSDVVDIYHINDYLASKGWRMNGCQNPPGFHFCMTLRQALPGVAEAFVEDLKAGVAYARNPAQPFPKSGMIYGLAGMAGGQEFLREGLLDIIGEFYEV
jgi:glutamate/tyrosine decarboxylase-like PLP-dependent enzyme